MAELRLVIFDVDGTLIDSLAHIKWAMAVAFEACDLPRPSDEDIRGIIGLSLPQAMDRLSPNASDSTLKALVVAYSQAFGSQAEKRPEISFFPGALNMLKALSERDHVLLAVATGKSRRGMDRIIRTYGFETLFQSVQVADDHPSKPHPSMVLQCLQETGVDADRAIMVGDTTFDLEMGRSAGVSTIGVDWGYHPTEHLRPFADAIVQDFDALHGAFDDLWRAT